MPKKSTLVKRYGKIGIVCFYQLNTATFSGARPGLLPACTVQRQEQPQVGQESVCTLAGSVLQRQTRALTISFFLLW